MKFFIFILLISQGLSAAEYYCQGNRPLRITLNTSGPMTDLIIKDAQSGEYYYNGIVTDIISRNGLTDLMFETRSNSFLQLQFKSSDLEKETDTLFGFSRGWYGAGFIDSSLKCLKKN